MIRMPATRQQGAVLLVALVFLLILTVAGVSAIRLANVEERMTGNFADRNVAFQAAEAALREAEEYIRSKNFADEAFYNGCVGTDCFVADCTGGLCFSGDYEADNTCTLAVPATPGAEVYQSASVWADDSGKHREATTGLDNVTARYLIEFRCYGVKDADIDPELLNDATLFYDATIWEPLYRITAFAVGRSQSARVMLQSTFRRD